MPTFPNSPEIDAGVLRAYISFNEVDNLRVLTSLNISSVVNSAVGKYQIPLINPMRHDGSPVSGMAGSPTSSTLSLQYDGNGSQTDKIQLRLAGKALYIGSQVSVKLHGDLA